MKHVILSFGLVLCLGKLSCGQGKDVFFFNEFQISLNRTYLHNDNTEDRFGFGLGAYHAFRADKKLNIVFGLEYNRSSLFKKSMYEGHFAHFTNVTYHLNSLSIPLGLRLTMGSGIKIFIEIGGLADLVISSNRSGIKHSFVPNENNQLVYNKTGIDEKAELNDAIGVYFGLGIRIPVSGFELIVKPEYKFGLRPLYSYQDEIFSRYFRINIGLKIK